MKTVDKVRVYRFNDTVAISLKKGGEFVSTEYLDPAVARKLSIILANIAEDITDVNFSSSVLGTYNIEPIGANRAGITKE